MQTNLNKVLFNLVLSILFFKLLEYFVKIQYDQIIGFSNYVKVVILIIFYYIYRFRFETYLLVVILFFYTFYGDEPALTNIQYMVDYELTIFALIYYGSSEIHFKLNFLDSEKIKIYIYIFLFVVFYAVTAYINGPELRGDERIAEPRIYYNGFIIAHAYAYLIVTMSLLLIRLKNTKLGVILVLSTAIVGTRTGIVLASFAMIRDIFRINKIKHMLLLFIGGFLLTILFFAYFDKYIENIINMFSFFTLDIFSMDSEKAFMFTSGRNIIWVLALGHYFNESSFFQYLFGFGTFSSMSFNELMINNKIWLHNDFFDILFNMGAFGLFYYIYGIFRFLKKSRMYFIVLFIFFAGFSNGFFVYDGFVLISFLMYAEYFRISNLRKKI